MRRVLELPNESAFERAQAEGWEGVIAKLRGSIYEQRRSRNWLKMKCELAQEFVVGGFTDPQGKRVGLEEFARQMIQAEEMHAAEVDKMLRKPGELAAFAPRAD